MAIPKETVDQIFNTLRIEEVVGDYVSLRRRGASLWGLCPFPGHNEKTPSFAVTPSRNICKCFGCGRGGSAVNFIMEMEQCSYPDALRKLAQKYHIEIEEREMTAEEKQHHDDRESMFVVNEWANKWYQDQLWETEEGRAVGYSYFRERGLRDETIRKFQLGYSPEKGFLLPQAAQKQGFKEHYLTNDPETRIGTGICGKGGQSNKLYDRYHDRVMFPFFSVSGKTVGFAGRIIRQNDKVGKYVNSPESLVYSKKNELFGFFQAKASIHKAKHCYLVEGQMDCISMSQAGIENVVCSGGTALTKEQVRLIHRFADSVTILYDGDAAGIKAALKGIDMFLMEGLNVKVMLFPDGDDPDSFSRKHTAQEFKDFIVANEEDFIRFKTRILLDETSDDLRRRSEALHSIVESISCIGDRITRDLYIKETAQVFGVAETTLVSHMLDIRHKRRDEQIKEEERRQRQEALAPNEPPIIGVDDDLPEEPVAPVASTPVTPKTPIEQNAFNIMRMLIRYGTQKLEFTNPDGSSSTFSVGGYMWLYLQNTQLSLCNDLYTRIFHEFLAHENDEDFVPSTYFLNYDDPVVSALTADLLSEKYVLSKVYHQDEEAVPDQTRLTNEMMQLLYELHFTSVEESLKVLNSAIKTATSESAAMQIIQSQQQLIMVRNQLCQLLGKY